MSDTHARNAHARVFLGIARWCVFLLLLLVPLLYIPVSLDALELHKQTLVIILSLAGSLAWIGGMISEKSLALHRGWMNIPPMILWLAVVLSAMFSIGPYRSWIGSAGQDYQSVIAITALTALFYLSANVLRSDASHTKTHVFLLLGAAITAVIGTVSLLKGGTFSTIGSVNAFGVYLAVMTTFALAHWLAVSSRTKWTRIENGLIAVLFLASVLAFLVIDYWVVWTTLLVGMGVIFAFLLVRIQGFLSPSRMVLPFFLIALALPFLFWLQTPFTQPPAEVSPTFGASWDIATQTLHEHSALLGSGPGTFQYDYAQFHDTDVNQTAFWNRRFDRASSFALTALASVGVLGAIAWLLFLLSALGRASQEVIMSRTRETWMPTFVLLAPLTALTVALFLYPANMTTMFLLFIFAGLIGGRVMKTEFVSTFAKSRGLAMAFSSLFVIASTLLLILLFISTQRYAAEIAFAKAVTLDRENAPLHEVTRELDTAATFNRFNDAYFRNLAQAYLLRAGEEIDALSDPEVEEGRNKLIQAFTFASVNGSARAVALAPEDVSNWLVRGSVMREFLPLVPGAREEAIKAYRTASALEPASPEPLTELGKTYLAAAEHARTLMASEDVTVRTGAQKENAEFLARAETALTHAIALKPDYAPAHFQLALALEQQGRIDEAVAKMLAIAAQNQIDVGVQFQLGLLFMRRGQAEDLHRARVAFERTVELAPGYANARWFLASVYEQLGNLEGALAQVEKVRTLNPDNTLVNARLERLRQGIIEKNAPPPVEEGNVNATDAE